jgi:hypothetical protein
MERRQKIVFAASLVAFILFCYLLMKPSSDDFCLEQVTSNLKVYPQWSLPNPTEEEKKALQPVLSQTFKYLGKGAQAYAFESEDGKYVLKLFKMRRFTSSWLDCLCPHVVRRRHRNLTLVFNGYKYGYQHLREETGVVWIHLAKTNVFHQKLNLVDPKGKPLCLDVDSTEFVIQEKAELLFSRLERLHREGKEEDVEKAIQSVLELVQKRTDKGFVDRDKAVSNNYGFVGSRPIHLDLGSLYQGSKPGHLEHIKRRIERWRDEHPSTLSSLPLSEDKS